MSTLRSLFLVLVASALAACADVHVGDERQSAPVPVPGPWQYRAGDSPRDADGNFLYARGGADDGWHELEPLGPPGERSDDRFLWYRFRLPAGDFRDPALFLGELSDDAEIFLDGRRIWGGDRITAEGQGTTHATVWALVPLPKDFAGRLVTCRFYSDFENVGIKRRAVVGDRAELLLEVVHRELDAFITAVVALLLGLAALAAFLGKTRAPSHLSFAGFAIASGMFLVGVNGMRLLVVRSSFVWLEVTFFGLYLTVPALNAFVHHALVLPEGGVVKPLNLQVSRIHFAVAAVQCVLAAFYPASIGRIFPFTLLLVVVGIAVALFGTVRIARAGSRDAAVVLLGVGVLLVTAVHGSIAALGWIRDSFSRVHWGILFFVGALGYVVVRQFGSLQARADEARRLAADSERREGLARELQRASQALVASVEALAGASRQQSQVLVKQAAALQEAQVTSTELRQTALSAAAKAQGVLGIAAEADDAGRSGAAAVEQSLGMLEGIGGAVSELATRIGALQQRAGRIQGIVDTVKALADQTNLLALNAALEAVRAGESGRGFGLVAREMRALAERTLRSTREIRDVLESVGEGVRDATELGERTVREVGASVQQVRVSGETLRRLSEHVRLNADAARQIAATVGQQSNGIEMLVTTVGELSAMMDDTLVRLRETEQATEGVHAVASDVARLVPDGRAA